MHDGDDAGYTLEHGVPFIYLPAALSSASVPNTVQRAAICLAAQSPQAQAPPR